MTASTQKWKLVVTKLGGSDVLHEQELEASNWMGALRAARHSMGERASVPPGASCSVDVSGSATVLDPGTRRKFMLTPLGLPAAQPPVPAAAPANAPPAEGPAAGSKEQRLQTVAFVPPKTSPASQTDDQTAPASSTPKSKGKFRTVAYMDGVPPSTDAAAARARLASPSREEGQAAPTGGQAEPGDDPRAQQGSPEPGPPVELSEIMARDEEPTADNPLTYCERAYLLPQGATITEAEAAMRFRLADLQTRLQSQPKGRFVNLALFDHSWQDVPERPPLIVLQWRDWRDEVLVDYPATQLARSGSPETQPAHDDRLDEVFGALSGLSHVKTPADGLEFAVGLLDRVLPCEAISGCLYDINTDELRCVTLTGPSAEALQGRAIPRTAGLFGVAMRDEPAATVVHDVLAHPSFEESTDSRPGLAAYNMVLQPLTHDAHLLGVLQLVNRQGAPAFSDTDLHLLNYLAERLSEFLHRVRARPQA